MSSRRVVPVLLAAALASLAPPSPAAGAAPRQEPQSEEELLQRIDELRPQVAEAQTTMEEAQRRRRLEEARQSHPAMDTIAVGPVRVVTPPEQAELARELFSEVWSEHYANVGESPSLARHYVTFQWRLRPERIYMTPEEEGGAPVARVELYRLTDRSRSAVKNRIRVALSGVLIQDFPRGVHVRQWLWGYHPGDLEPASAFRELALSASLGGAFRECLAGRASACWTAERLDEPDRLASLVASFSLDEQASLVQRAYEASAAIRRARSPSVDAPPAWSRCVAERVEEACSELTPNALEWAVDAAGGMTALRWTLFWHAVGRGGEGAWERAVERVDAPVGEVLTHASGLQPNELVESWLDELAAHRPAVRANLAVTRWAVFLWVLIFMALALRSTRWRLH